MFDIVHWLITWEQTDDNSILSEEQYDGKSIPFGEPYSVNINGNWIEITNKSTGQTSRYWANNEQQGRQWRVYDNHYYRDENGNRRQNVSYDNKLPWEIALEPGDFE